MHIVLLAIQDYWEQQTQDGHGLPADHEANLRELSGSCKAVLVEVQTLLNKNTGLGSGAAPWARLRWAPKDIAPLRMRLLSRTNSLSTLNNVIMYVAGSYQIQVVP